MLRQACVFAVLFATLLVAAAPAPADPTVSSKEAEARSVLDQVRGLDGSLAKAIEAYNLANERLGAIRSDLEKNRAELGTARTSLRHAQASLEARLVALYTAGNANSTVEVLLGATSVEDLVSRLDTAERVSDQDARVVREVIRYRNEIARRRARLRDARVRQARLVNERAAHKASIESQLAERRRLLSTIRSEITALQAAERRRQAALERQARVRLTASTRVTPPLAPNPVETDTEAPILSAPPARHGGVVGIAMQYLGTPYVYGGASPGGFDCSGFVMYVYAQVGVSLPHNAAAQYGHGVPVSRSQLQPGDLVFFNGLGHNGIYIGGGQFIHSPHTGDVVKISSLSGWYDSTWVGARRIS